MIKTVKLDRKFIRKLLNFFTLPLPCLPSASLFLFAVSVWVGPFSPSGLLSAVGQAAEYKGRLRMWVNIERIERTYQFDRPTHSQFQGLFS